MDAKKTNLTPELKEIYDRVMNTPTGTAPTNANATTAPASPLPSSPNPLDVPNNQAPMDTPHPPPSSGPNPLNGMQGMPISKIDTPPLQATNTNGPTATQAMPSLPNFGDKPAPAVAGLSPAPGMPSMPGMPSVNGQSLPDANLGMPTPAEQALSNSPARPISEGNTFAFNGTVKAAPTPPVPGALPVAGKKKAKISLPILIVLGVVFIIVWGVFWAIILGFVQK